MITICAVSDTHHHTREGKVVTKPADILIHAGDFSGMGTQPELEKAAAWFAEQPQKHKIAVMGNHELWASRHLDIARKVLSGITLLFQEEITIEGLRIWGSPITPTFLNWAFMRDRGPSIREIWDQIPEGLDILITHGPPRGILDQVFPLASESLGCWDLKDVVTRKLQQPPKVHIFGHIHGSGGRDIIVGNTHFYNAAICNEDYAAMNPITLIEVNK